jgi:tetrahydromethanopterin S-methyltransferase subunit A
VDASGPYFASGDPESPVAICTLSSHSLLAQLAESPIRQAVAIIGSLETPNLGIERMLLTLLDQPRIRWLIVCGDESRGRYQGRALLALFEHGIDATGQIVSAPGRRARLANVSSDLVEAARRQVRLKNLLGVAEVETIARAVEECRADDPGPFEERVELPKPDPIVVPAQRFRLKEHDPQGFFIILVDRREMRLLVEHYTSDGQLAHRIAGPDAESLSVALVDWGLVSRLEHAAYLGRELVSAEHALRSGVQYRQDEPDL